MFARHNPWLSDRTDPADPVVRSLVVDGEDHTGDWSITDFTVAELKQWIGGTTYDARDQRPTALNGKYPVLTVHQITGIAKAKSAATGRTIRVYPESKNLCWNNQQAIAKAAAAVRAEVPGRFLQRRSDGEYLAFFRAGIDGVFTDFAANGVAARMPYLTETGH